VQKYTGKLAVLYPGQGDIHPFQQLSERLAVPVRNSSEDGFDNHELFFLTWRDGCLQLLDKELLKNGGLVVDIEPRNGEQRSWPAPKQGAFAKALGRKTRTVVDATTGWGQDSLRIFRMGYEVFCIERSPVMAELLIDWFNRLAEQCWMQKLNLQLQFPFLLLIGCCQFPCQNQICFDFVFDVVFVIKCLTFSLIVILVLFVFVVFCLLFYCFCICFNTNNNCRAMVI